MAVQGLQKRVLSCCLVDVRWNSSLLFTAMGRAGVWKFALDVIVVCWDLLTCLLPSSSFVRSYIDYTISSPSHFFRVVCGVEK
jgi:hypothetical protein